MAMGSDGSNRCFSDFEFFDSPSAFCLLLVGAYLGFNWSKIKQHDVKTIASMKLILVLVAILIVLEAVQQLLG